MDVFIYINRLSTALEMPQKRVFLHITADFAVLCRPVIHNIHSIHNGRNGKRAPIFFFENVWYAEERKKGGVQIP